jgi:hypothetical protein
MQAGKMLVSMISDDFFYEIINKNNWISAFPRVGFCLLHLGIRFALCGE